MNNPIRHDKWTATEYVNASDMQWRHAMEAIRWIDYRNASRILDVGCGDGRVTHYIAENLHRGKVIGIDLTEDMVRYAREKYAREKNLFFQKMSADEIEFDQCFDIIFSFSCLHWVADQAKVWDSFYKILKEDGKGIIGFQVGHENFWDTVSDFQNNSQWQAHFTGFRDPYNHYILADMKAVIERAGFYIPRMDEIHHVENFGTPETLMTFFLSWVPQFRHLSPPKRELFAQQVMDAYYQKISPKMCERAGVRIKRYIIEVEK
ncbi:methyltransferase domain-containing protein [Microbulbifer sp. OS29]|uniref:Methyltransferase domain-containing protein n=1 Tax=Microbulbifer okhotskensis TaxID=2926617 RepID=A0A9X2EKD9_9GAMM|nr:class I SAM-dependent methyltransferase [Microbulbifer okhotskensis]MCO1333842.1 methyltransferase domain-containing protein [Microbulbifer okhotskensis]